MTDYISLDKAVAEILSEPTDAHYPSWYAEKLKQIPAADVVEVVRCKDCKWAEWYLAENGNYYCHCIECDRYGYEKTDYCSYGERRTDNGK